MSQEEKQILVADDEEVMRTLIRDILTRYGYKVLMASNGNEALEIYRNKTNDIMLVILDLFMPNMNGEETFKEIRTINPDAVVLFTSGLSHSNKFKELIASGAKGIIPKPFIVSEFMRIVRQVIQSHLT